MDKGNPIVSKNIVQVTQIPNGKNPQTQHVRRDEGLGNIHLPQNAIRLWLGLEALLIFLTSLCTKLPTLA
jgi:hypothetical protein